LADVNVSLLSDVNVSLLAGANVSLLTASVAFFQLDNLFTLQRPEGD
jgi:hypothetical protein